MRMHFFTFNMSIYASFGVWSVSIAGQVDSAKLQ